ncbi:NYN domain-containing protein [Patescibacteria group bacterium]|nr:NYN domain-containing protein [Patescibacteria group bacterium]
MTVIKHTKQRVGIFIDAQNLYHSARNLYSAKANFKQILEDAVANRALIRAIAYVITTESGEESTFFDALVKLGIETKTKDLQIFFGGAKKADWDVGLAVDAIKISPKLDTVIIVSGDGDYIPLVEYLQISQGCQVEVIAFGKSSSAKLIEAADDFLDLDSDPQKYLMGYRGNKNRNNQKKQEGKQQNKSSQKKQNSSKKTTKNPNSNKKAQDGRITI